MFISIGNRIIATTTVILGVEVRAVKLRLVQTLVDEIVKGT